MNFFYEAVDVAGKTVLGRMDADDEIAVRRELQQMGFVPKAVALNHNATGMQPAYQQTAMPMQAQSGVSAPQAVSPQNGMGYSGIGALQANPAVARSGNVVLSGSAARVASKLQTRNQPAARYVASIPDNASLIGGVKDRDRLNFFQQLASLVKSGMSIYSALENLSARTPNPNLARTAKEMAEAARTGHPISEVMARYPNIYEENITAIVRGGELGGFLEIALSEIALNYEQNIALFRHAWIPKVMAIQALYLLAIAAPFMPSLLQTGTSDFSFMASALMYLKWELVLLPLATLIVVGISWGWNQLKLSKHRRFRDQMLLKMPPFGDLQRQAALAAFNRMLRRLYNAGVAPIHAWEGAMNTAGNLVIREKLASSYSLMQTGASLADAFNATGLFTNEMENVILTGQQSGEMTESLDRITEYYQDEAAAANGKSKFALFRIGLLALLILTGAAVCWVAWTYFHGMFTWVDHYFSPPD